MANEIQVFEQQLAPLAPRFQAVLGDLMPVERLTQTAIICVERNPKLLECTRQSLLNSCMTFATLALEIDGATGQGFIIPFAGKAQPVIGYKGYNTLAARSGYTVTGDVIRDGDEIEFEKGTSARVRHVPLIGGGLNRKIIGAWACATAQGRTPIVEVMGFDELMAVKNKSPGAKKKDSPWNDPSIGFPAMCQKTVKRRLARSMPLNVMQYAAALDEAFEERGLPGQIDPDHGVVINGEAVEILPPVEAEQKPIPAGPDWLIQLADGEVHQFQTKAQFLGYWKKGIAQTKIVGKLDTRIKDNEAVFEKLRNAGQGIVVDEVLGLSIRRKEELNNA